MFVGRLFLRPGVRPQGGYPHVGHVFFLSMMMVLLALLVDPVKASFSFNFEVEKRVLDRLNDFMDGPIKINNAILELRENGLFPHNLDARDRDPFITVAYTLMYEFQFDFIYFGLEDGTFVG